MMENSIARYLSLVAIYGVFGSTFLLAGGSKLLGKTVPDWFKNQFGGTFMADFPGLTISYWSIAFLEILVPCLLAMSLIKQEFVFGYDRFYLQIAISVSSVIFTMLGFGLRLAGDFAGAANLFAYFAGSLVAQIFVTRFL